MDWWITIVVGGAGHCCNIGDPADDTREDLLMRARVLVGFAAGDDWFDGDLGRSSVQFGPQPHPDLLARAVVHTLAELAAVNPVTVTAYVAQCAMARRQVRLDSARAAAAILHPDDKAVLKAELGPAPLPNPSRSV